MSDDPPDLPEVTEGLLARWRAVADDRRGWGDGGWPGGGAGDFATTGEVVAALVAEVRRLRVSVAQIKEGTNADGTP